VPAPLTSTPSAARSGPLSGAAPLTATSSAKRSGPPSVSPSLGHEGAPSQPASWAASRPPTLPPGAAGTSSRPAALAPALSRPAPLAASSAAGAGGARSASSKTWLGLAGGGLFVAIAAIAAWQFSARRDPAAIDPVSAASAPAASVAGIAPAAAPASPMIVETATSNALDSTTSRPTAAAVTTPSVAANGDTAARPSLGEHAPIVDASAASAARVRPPGKPVPRVGDDPALTASTTGAGTARTPDGTTVFPNTGVPTTNGDRSRPPSATAARDAYVAGQRSATPSYEAAPESVRDVCGKLGFIARAVCLDERCEEARFRSTPECIGILARKTSRQNQ
jgi:hypothetical protein